MFLGQDEFFRYITTKRLIDNDPSDEPLQSLKVRNID